MPRYSKHEQEEAKTSLREYCPAGSTVSLVLQSVSRSGMSRTIKCLATDKDGNPFDISWYVSRACELPLADGFMRGVRIGGCGMDMGFALVDMLSYALYNKPVDQSKKWNPEDATGGLKYIWL